MAVNSYLTFVDLFFFAQSMGGDQVEGVVGATIVGVALPTEAGANIALSEGEQSSSSTTTKHLQLNLE